MDKMKDINIDTLLKATIESQEPKEEIPVDFEEGTRLLITGTGDTDLECYVGKILTSTGIQQNYSKTIKKTKMNLPNGGTAYFKNDYLKRVN